MDLTVTLFWSFRSPYSYIVLPRVMALRANSQVTIDLRVVHPAAIRNPSYFTCMDPLARPYFLKDTARAAAFHGLPFRRPIPDPIDQDPTTLAIAGEQPLALKLGRLGIAATYQGRGLEFADEISRVLWDGSVSDWHKGSHLAEATALAGLDLEDLQAAVDAAPDRCDTTLASNGEALRAAGHWGVPTMVFDGEPFFGQDRFDLLVWRMKQRGLKPHLTAG